MVTRSSLFFQAGHPCHNKLECYNAAGELKKMSRLRYYITLATSGTEENVDSIMTDLTDEMIFVDSKFIDYALGLVKSDEGIKRIAFYLFNGTQIQRNYCTLFFNRRNEKEAWVLVKQAYNLGLIDKKQAFSK